MAMFSGKLSTERRNSPKKLSNALPEGVVYVSGKYYKVLEGNKMVEITLKSKSFSTFFKTDKAEKVAG